MPNYALHDHAIAICDRCGLTVKLKSLINQTIDRKPSGIMVCKHCLDIDQEQLQVGKQKIDDPMALPNPRPDHGEGREPVIPFDPPILKGP
jgi:hypothetical protein